ncbi:hypothetical protein ABZQ47_15970, partial [Pseudomonas aeruginosa]
MRARNDGRQPCERRSHVPTTPYQAVEKSQSPRGSGKMAAILFCRSQPKPMRGLDLKQNELFSYT